VWDVRCSWAALRWFLHQFLHVMLEPRLGVRLYRKIFHGELCSLDRRLLT
jgi:hypothetical protein